MPDCGIQARINGITRRSVTTNENIKSVKSINPCKSVIQTSYDIVKAHGGEIIVETKESDGSEFVIQLPA
jgi:hypothetical protein